MLVAMRVLVWACRAATATQLPVRGKACPFLRCCRPSRPRCCATHYVATCRPHTRMVLYFHPRGWQDNGRDDWLIYMGENKYVNEDLIKYGLPTDVWCAQQRAAEQQQPPEQQAAAARMHQGPCR